MIKMSKVIETLNKISDDEIKEIADDINIYGTVYICANGGGSSTSLHLSADLEAIGIRAICLNSNVSRLTAAINDFGWEHAYTEQVKDFICSADTLIIFSVHGGSGKIVDGKVWSSNLVNVAKLFKERNSTVIGFIGDTGGELKNFCNKHIIVDSNHYAIVEGIHSIIAHLLVEYLKSDLQ